MNLHNRIKDLSSQLKNIENSDGFSCDEEGRGVINVGAEFYDDIFSPYCYKGGDTLSLEMIEYLWEKQEIIPLDYDLTIRFNIKNATEEKRKEIQMAVKKNFENDIHAVDQKMQRTMSFSTWFVIIGIILTAVYLLSINFVPKAVSYIIDILAWVFVWEGVRAYFLDRRDLKTDKVRSLRLAAAKIEVKEFEIY